MTQLYVIANEYAKLTAQDLEPEFIADTLEGIQGEFEEKVEQLLAIIKNEAAYAEALKEESKSLAERAKVSENKVENIKAYIASAMETAGQKSLRAGLHAVTVRAPSKSVEITDESKLPIEFVEYITSIKADTMAIKHQLNAGVDVPGARIKFGKQSLLIK